MQQPQRTGLTSFDSIGLLACIDDPHRPPCLSMVRRRSKARADSAARTGEDESDNGDEQVDAVNVASAYGRYRSGTAGPGNQAGGAWGDTAGLASLLCGVWPPGQEALTRAAEVLTEDNRGRRPDDELARAWAMLGKGWAPCRMLMRLAAWQPLPSPSTRWVSTPIRTPSGLPHHVRITAIRDMSTPRPVRSATSAQ